MGTRSRVGIKTAEGIKVIHVHYSEPAYAQEEMLNKYYPNPEDASKLINNGDLSILDETLDECEPVGNGRYSLEERQARTFKDVEECLAETDAGWVVLYDPETRTWARAGHAEFYHTEEDYEEVAEVISEELSNDPVFWAKHTELLSRLGECAKEVYFEERDYGASVDHASYEASYKVYNLKTELEREEA